MTNILWDGVNCSNRDCSNRKGVNCSNHNCSNRNWLTLFWNCNCSNQVETGLIVFVFIIRHMTKNKLGHFWNLDLKNILLTIYKPNLTYAIHIHLFFRKQEILLFVNQSLLFWQLLKLCWAIAIFVLRIFFKNLQFKQLTIPQILFCSSKPFY